MGFTKQQQEVPGVQSAMSPVPDCGENSYRGSGRLTGKRAVITGGDSGIGRASRVWFVYRVVSMIFAAVAVPRTARIPASADCFVV